jgi:hypothetical protein
MLEASSIGHGRTAHTCIKLAGLGCIDVDVLKIFEKFILIEQVGDVLQCVIHGGLCDQS